MLRFSTRQRHAADSSATDLVYSRELGLTINPKSSAPAVLDPTVKPLMTKKEDIEKGEDRKSRWI